MIKFRQKEYTIQEGHYTGTKAIKKIPGALKVITKSVLAGLGIGSGLGVLAEEVSIGEGAEKGMKAGFWAGIALKVLIDRFHKPMSSVKFQKVDKAIRSEYGIKEISGMIVGDSREKRDDLDAHFSFNDSNILDYKINVSIQKKQVTLYTLNLEKKELGELNKSLDYFCYKYHGMEYSSKLINEKKNSYSITITFTNYEAIAKFLIEVASVSNIKINVLDEGIDFEKNLKKDEKNFSLSSSSLPLFDRYDLIKILGKGGTIITKSGFKTDLGDYATDILMEAISHINNVSRIVNLPSMPTERKSFSNKYLEKSFKDLRFKEGFDYTVGKNKGDFNIYLHQGYLFICSALPNKLEIKFDGMIKKYKVTVTNVKNQAKIYTYVMKSREDLNSLLRDIIKLGIKPNIYTK